MRKFYLFWSYASVNIDVIIKKPRLYFTAVLWWVLRKRVRAKGQFAVLLGQSSKAYSLWGFVAERDQAEHSPPGSPPVYAIIDARGPSAQLHSTLKSVLAESMVPVVIDEHANACEKLASAISDDPAWVMFLSSGDRLAPGTAAIYRAQMHDPSIQVIYADDDALDNLGRRTKPHLKPDWNGELFRHFDFVTGASVIRVNREKILAEFLPIGGAGVTARTIDETGRAIHIKRVLHHRATRPVPKMEAAVVRSDLPLLTAIIPTRNRVDLLSKCLAGLENVLYPSLEVIVVDNDSDDPATLDYLTALLAKGVRVIRHSGPFNYSAINNRAVAVAKGKLLCLLNNDIEMLAQDWLPIMASQAMRDDVGAVGAKLLYPDGRIQHAGVVTGVGNAAGHAHRLVKPHEEGYFHRHSLPQFVTAVTAACMVLRRDRFLAVGGLDELNFKVAFNDVDLCLRLNERGWQSFYEPRATLVHHESVSRGHDTDPVGAARFAGELDALKRIWKTDQVVDPFHHPYLSRASEQFAVAL